MPKNTSSIVLSHTEVLKNRSKTFSRGSTEELFFGRLRQCFRAGSEREVGGVIFERMQKAKIQNVKTERPTLYPRTHHGLEAKHTTAPIKYFSLANLLVVSLCKGSFYQGKNLLTENTMTM